TVLIPLALAVLLTFVLAPLVALLQRTGLPRVPAVILVVLFALIVVGAIGSTLTMQVQRLAMDLPQYKENIVHKTAGLRGLGQNGYLGQLEEMFNEITGNPANQNSEVSGKQMTEPLRVQVESSRISLVERFAGPTAEVLASTVL